LWLLQLVLRLALGTIAKSAISNAAGGGNTKIQMVVLWVVLLYGDKILARVNSGEMIANSEQQKHL
jgi:hypothetical protein